MSYTLEIHFFNVQEILNFNMAVDVTDAFRSLVKEIAKLNGYDEVWLFNLLI